MNITIETTELGIVFKCDKPFLRGVAPTLPLALDSLKKFAVRRAAEIESASTQVPAAAI